MAVYFILYCAICEMVIEWFFLCNWRAYMRRLILFFFRGICAFSVLNIFFHCLVLLGSFSWMVSRSNIYVFLVSSSNCSGKWWIYGYIFWISIKDLKVVLSGPPIVYVLHIFFFLQNFFWNLSCFIWLFCKVNIRKTRSLVTFCGCVAEWNVGMWDLQLQFARV